MDTSVESAASRIRVALEGKLRKLRSIVYPRSSICFTWNLRGGFSSEDFVTRSCTEESEPRGGGIRNRGGLEIGGFRRSQFKRPVKISHLRHACPCFDNLIPTGRETSVSVSAGRLGPVARDDTHRAGAMPRHETGFVPRAFDSRGTASDFSGTSSSTDYVVRPAPF